jgi:hypothetical protein
MARARFSAYKSSIINRTGESGGSLGGNDKAGLVTLWQWSMVPTSAIQGRLTNACCKDPILSLATVKPMPKKTAAGADPKKAPPAKPKSQGYYFNN